MILPASLRPHWSKCITLALGWLGAALALQAQTATSGTVQGRVYNPVSKVYVLNAEVRLEGTQQVTYTENDGSFQFLNVPTGEHTITVTFTGYQPAKETFTVSSGQTAVREIDLKSTAESAPTTKDGIVQLQAFTVSSEREGNAKAIQAQRRDMNIITSVSSDIFGDVADGNVGEFLKYLPGVDLDYVESEARGPRLNGQDGQYVGVSFDGMRTASADANRGGGAASRATSFEGFSITSIESIEINRTASAENDGDSPAGSINMRTKRAFDRKGRLFSYAFSTSLNSEEFTLRKTDGPRDKQDHKWKPNWVLGYTESFLNQKLGINLGWSRSYSYTEQVTESLGYNRTPISIDPRPLVIRQLDFKDGPKFIGKDSLLATADWKVTPHLVLSLNMTYSYYEGEFWNRNFTFVASNDNANANVANGRASLGGDGVTSIIATRVSSGSTATSKTNNVAALNDGGGGAAKLQYVRQFAPKFEYKLGTLMVDGALALSKAKNNYESLERGFSKDEGGSDASSFIATRSGPRAWEWTIRQTSGADWFDLHSFTGGTRVTNDDRTWNTEKWTGTLNARWVVPFMERFPTILKFGGKWDEESRKNHDHGAVSTWSYFGPGGNTVRINPTLGTWENASTSGNWANVGPQYISPNPFEMGTTDTFAGGGIYNIKGQLGMAPRPSRNEMSNLFHEHPELFVNTTTPENFFTSYINNERNFRQTITAGYSQIDIRLTSKLQFRTGMRVEETKNALTEYDPLTRAQVAAAGYAVNAPGTNNGRAVTIPGMIYQYMSQPRVTRTSQYHSWFPSALAKYNFLPNFEWQAGINKGIGRPAIDDLTGLWVVNESNQTVTAPNPNLQPEKHENIQSRLIYYFGGRSPGQASVAVSRNEASHFVTSQTYSADEFGVDDPDFAAYRFVTKRNNDSLTRTKSMSLAYSQTLGFLPGEYLRGINLGGTYDRVYTSANVRRLNVAPHRVTGRLGYAYRRFNGSLGMIWIDDKPNDAQYGRFFGSFTKFDLTLNFRLPKFRDLSLYVQGRNITNVKDEWYESPPGVEEGKHAYLRGMEEYGANWVFGVKGTF